MFLVLHKENSLTTEISPLIGEEVRDDGR